MKYMIYIYEYIRKNPFIWAEIDDSSQVRHPTGVKLARSWSQLQASHVSSNTEVLRYSETACLCRKIFTLPSLDSSGGLQFFTWIEHSDSVHINIYLKSLRAYAMIDDNRGKISGWRKVRHVLIPSWSISRV